MTKREKRRWGKMDIHVIKAKHAEEWRLIDDDHFVETQYDARLRRVVRIYASHEEAIAAAKSALASRYSFQRPLIHRPPGTRLNAFASFVFRPHTYERVFKPYLAETQFEYFEALSEGKANKARWVRVRGVLGFWWTVVLQMPVSLTKLVQKLWTVSGG